MSVDIVGLLPKPSRNGKKYILVVVDFATRYSEAIALSNIEAETLATALLTIFNRLGFPKEILTNCGTNFNGCCFYEVMGIVWSKASEGCTLPPQN